MGGIALSNWQLSAGSFFRISVIAYTRASSWSTSFLWKLTQNAYFASLIFHINEGTKPADSEPFSTCSTLTRNTSAFSKSPFLHNFMLKSSWHWGPGRGRVASNVGVRSKMSGCARTAVAENSHGGIADGYEILDWNLYFNIPGGRNDASGSLARSSVPGIMDLGRRILVHSRIPRIST